MASNGASHSEAGGIGGVDKIVFRPVQLVADLKPFFIYSFRRIRHHDYLHITWLFDKAAVDERHVRRILKVVGLSFSNHFVIDQEHDNKVIYFISGICCEFKFEDAWARDAECGDQGYLCHFIDKNFLLVNEEVVLD